MANLVRVLSMPSYLFRDVAEAGALTRGSSFVGLRSTMWRFSPLLHTSLASPAQLFSTVYYLAFPLFQALSDAHHMKNFTSPAVFFMVELKCFIGRFDIDRCHINDLPITLLPQPVARLCCSGRIPAESSHWTDLRDSK